MALTKKQLEIVGKSILEWEARRDSKGRLAVYKLPPEDGGGTFEVAGINDRYHKAKAVELRDLIKTGKYAEAEIVARNYMISMTDIAAGWTTKAAVEAFLRDSCFNRGATGGAKIYQIALGVAVDGGVGKETLKAANAQINDTQGLLLRLRVAREHYERKFVGRDETSIFWKGLVNRWNKALALSQGFL